MPLTHCPHCDALLTHQEEVRGVCWSCGKSPFRAVGSGEPVSSRPAEAEEPAELLPIEEEKPAGRKPAGRPENPLLRLVPALSGNQVLRWGTVRAALALIPTGMMLTGASALLLMLTLGSSDVKRSEEREALAICGGLVAGAGVVLTLTGQCMCTVAPWASGAAGWAIASVVCLATAALLLVVYLVAEAQNRDAVRRNLESQFDTFPYKERPRPFRAEPLPWTPGALAALRYIMIGVCFLAGNLFTLFLHGIARHFRNSGLAASLLLYLVLSIFIGLAALGLSLSIDAKSAPLRKLDPDERTIVMIVGIGGLSVALVTWFVIQVFLVRGLITRALLRPRS
jgi:hypothetical protein